MDKVEIAYSAEKSWPTAIVTSSKCYGWWVNGKGSADSDGYGYAGGW